MLLEKTGIFSNAQSITGSTSIVSTNDIDLKASPFRDIGIGARAIYVVSQLTSSMLGAGITVTVNLQQSASAAAGPYTLIEVVGTFAALTTAGSTSAIIFNQIPPGVVTLEYLSLSYVMTGSLTGGAITSFVTPDIQKWLAYPKNYTLSTR